MLTGFELYPRWVPLSRARKGNDAENVRALKKGGIINKALWILNFLSYLRQSYLSEYTRDRPNAFITNSIAEF